MKTDFEKLVGCSYLTKIRAFDKNSMLEKSITVHYSQQFFNYNNTLIQIYKTYYSLKNMSFIKYGF